MSASGCCLTQSPDGGATQSLNYSERNSGMYLKTLHDQKSCLTVQMLSSQCEHSVIVKKNYVHQLCAALKGMSEVWQHANWVYFVNHPKMISITLGHSYHTDVLLSMILIGS